MSYRTHDQFVPRWPRGLGLHISMELVLKSYIPPTPGVHIFGIGLTLAGLGLVLINFLSSVWSLPLKFLICSNQLNCSSSHW